MATTLLYLLLLRHPLQHVRGSTIRELISQGIEVNVLGEDFESKVLEVRLQQVMEFDMLTPREVMEYFHLPGYLLIIWECGGTLVASVLSSSVIHKIVVFVAPKIFSGSKAPSRVGDLGMVE